MRKTWNTHGLIPCANLNLTDALIGRVHKNKGLQFLSSCIIWKIPFCLNIWISQFFYSLSFLHTSRLKSTRVQNGKRQIWNIASNLRRHEGVELCGSRLYLFYCLPIYLQINLEVKSQRPQVYFAAWLVLLSSAILRTDISAPSDFHKPSNFVQNHSRGFNAGLITRHGQISPFFQEKGREGEVPYKSSTPQIINCLLDIWKHTKTISGLY